MDFETNYNFRVFARSCFKVAKYNSMNTLTLKHFLTLPMK